MCWRHKPANRALRRGQDIPTSLTPTEPRSAGMQLSIGMLLLNVTIVTTRVLVKNEGGVRIGSVHSQR